MLFLFRSAPEVEKRIHSKWFRKFWEEPGYRRANLHYCKLLFMSCTIFERVCAMNCWGGLQIPTIRLLKFQGFDSFLSISENGRRYSNVFSFGEEKFLDKYPDRKFCASQFQWISASHHRIRNLNKVGKNLYFWYQLTYFSFFFFSCYMESKDAAQPQSGWG